jgi:DNA-binding NarL/FixJ family response regulator
MLTRELPARDSADRIKVVILEDGRYDRLGMAAELDAESSIELVSMTAAPEELLATIAAQQPAVAIVDLRIYDDDGAGLQFIRELRRAAPAVRIIVLTAFPELANFLTAFDLGVAAFVKKAAAGWRPTLGQLVKMVASGSCYYDPDLMGIIRPHLGGVPVPPDDAALVLPLVETEVSARELQVLHHLAANHTVPQIAEQLVISIHTVKTHIRNIKGKLGVKGRQNIVLAAIALGLLSPKSEQKK